MGKVLRFMCPKNQNKLKEAVKKLSMARLARTYYGMPRRKPDSFDGLLRIWRYVPESLKVELRHTLAPAFRKKAVILKDEKLFQEMEEFIADFKRKNQENEATK